MTATPLKRESSDTTEPILVTAALAQRASALRYDDLSPEARTVVGHCLMDFFGVTLAGRHEPLANILAEQVIEDGGTPQASVIGRNMRVNIEQAALLNGATSHALDFDDVNFAMNGHPTVPIAPAVLALAEYRGLDGKRLVEAFAAGFETACRVGKLVGRTHYQRGWHATATLGAIGAAAAVSNMLRLDANTTAHALGIAATQAAGLKSVFGTMCKPLHPGRAAAIGLQAARLASRGFTSNPAILDVEQGFAATQSENPNPAAALADPPGGFYLPQTLFKYHAACYLTHSSIEASNMLRREFALQANAIRKVTLSVDEGHLRVCNIEKPSTGLEVKFSLRATNALALLGENTASDATYSDATATRGEVVDLCRKVEIATWKKKSHTLSEVAVHLNDGRVLRKEFDVGIPMTDLVAQGQSLTQKFLGLAEPAIGAARAKQVVEITGRLGDAANVADLMALVAKAN
jgi:2-methylcitrate dehydratase PrpD